MSEALSGRRILIVEDDFILATELANRVSAAGGEVMGPVPGVASAMQLLDAGDLPAAALLDVKVAGGHVYPVAD